MDAKWFGNALQMFEATDEKDLKITMMVLRMETDIEEERSAHAVRILGWGMRDRTAAETVAP